MYRLYRCGVSHFFDGGHVNVCFLIVAELLALMLSYVWANNFQISDQSLFMYMKEGVEISGFRHAFKHLTTKKS